MKELLPGIFQIESKIGDNDLFLYLLRGHRTLLVDSGVRDTPDVAIFPALAAAGLPEQIDMLLITHADADHHGGSTAVQARSPHVTIMCHELDRQRIESKTHHLAGRYTDVIARDDVDYAPEIMDWLSDMIGPDTPVDIGLNGGETIGLGHGTPWEILHTPGHTAGHLSLWNPDRRVLIIQDAVFGVGQPNRAGKITSPPPYYDVNDYEATIQKLQTLDAELLLMAHYPPLGGASIANFFKASLEFASNMDITVLDVLQSAHQPLPLSTILAAIDARLGPFEVNIQWIGPTLAHLNRHVADGKARVQISDDIRTWQAS